MGWVGLSIAPSLIGGLALKAIMSLRVNEHGKGEGMIKRMLLLLVLFIVSCGGGFPVEDAVGIYKADVKTGIDLIYLDYSYKPGYRQSEENRLEGEDGKFMIIHAWDFEGWNGNNRILKSFGTWNIKGDELILIFSNRNSWGKPAGEKWSFEIDTDGFIGNKKDFFKKIKDGSDVQRSAW